MAFGVGAMSSEISGQAIYLSGEALAEAVNFVVERSHLEIHKLKALIHFLTCTVDLVVQTLMTFEDKPELLLDVF